MIQEGMSKTQESIANNVEETRRNHEELKLDVGEINDNIKKMDNKIEKIQQNIAKNEQRIQNMEVKMHQVEKKIDNMEQNQATLNKELEDSITYLEMEKASFYLRFQNIVENREEDLRDLMTGILAEATQREKEEISREIDEIYRVHTNYARRNKLPKEIHIRFARDYNAIADAENDYQSCKKNKFRKKTLPDTFKDMAQELQLQDVPAEEEEISQESGVSDDSDGGDLLFLDPHQRRRDKRLQQLRRARD
ncbi:basal body-orientation factor 1-like [Pituophis catenifer annectens]|uniref:basal body-orientation factor 1-like n=1 Tax=Pituophis catenifer annectens TaxID=94852 RepID=UPI0039933FAF